jgi:hypothetical protein
MTKIRIAGAAAGVVLVSGVVLQVSSAAFTGTTENAGNNWTAGTVTMTDDDGGSALYQTQADIVPGYTQTRCIEVTYTGSADLTKVDLYAAVTPTGPAADTLADDLDVTVQIGPALSGCNATGTGFADDATGLTPATAESTIVNNEPLSSFGTELSPETMSWVPDPAVATTTMRPFLSTVTPGNDTANDAQGDGASATFTWRASS